MATHSGIRDDGLRFQIVPSTRKITVPASHKVIGTVGDHMSEQITIMCPLTIDGHDIMGCARKFVTWKNVTNDVGHDELVFIEKDDEYVYFTWTIRDGLTVGQGVVQFSIHFEDTDDSGVVVYRWSTAPCDECQILDSVNAVLGAYQAIYVAGDTLVIADYNPVKDGTLSLDSAGIIPSGTLEITEEGEYDVGEFAAVKVLGVYEDPTIEVNQSGLITATANGVESTHKLDNVDCPRFVPENILQGVNIFGVTGSAPKTNLMPVTIIKLVNYTSTVDCFAYYSTVVDGKITNAMIDITQKTVSGTRDYVIQCIEGTPIVIASLGTFNITSGNLEITQFRHSGASRPNCAVIKSAKAGNVTVEYVG